MDLVRLAAASTVLQIDQPRKPMSRGAALAALTLYTIYFIVFLNAWQRLG